MCSIHKVSQRELANEICISEVGLQKVISRNATSVDTLCKLASYFNVPIGYFFGECIENTKVIQNGKINMNGTNNGNINISDAVHQIEKLEMENKQCVP